MIAVDGASSKSWAARLYVFILTAVWLVVGGTALALGFDYYRLPFQERAFSELYDAFKPSGFVGHGLGVVGSLFMIVGVATYSIRRRAHRLAGFGKLKYWLQFHIFLCTLGPFLVLLHTAFRFQGIVAIAFWSMAIVVASGVIGRYVYARIPKTINGQFLSLQAVQREQQEVVEGLKARLGAAGGVLDSLLDEGPREAPRGIVGAMALAVWQDLTARARTRRIRRLLARRGVRPEDRAAVLAGFREQRRLQNQILLLRPFQRLFGYWHVLHLPLAIVMFIIMALHVGVAIAFGYGWVL